jgi:hypothetical protein
MILHCEKIGISDVSRQSEGPLVDKLRLAGPRAVTYSCVFVSIRGLFVSIPVGELGDAMVK